MDSTEQRRDDTMEPTKHGGLRVIPFPFSKICADFMSKCPYSMYIYTFTLICC